MYTYTSGLGASPADSRPAVSGKATARATEEAKRTVQNIYLELLLRDPWNKATYDAGAEGYVNCLVDGWCDTDFVRTEVIKSPEYADKEMARAQRVYAPGGAVPSSAPGGYSSFAPMDWGGIMSMSVAGIPIVYLAGGLVLLMMLKKK